MAEIASPTADLYEHRARLRGALQVGFLALCSVGIAAVILAYPPGWTALAVLGVIGLVAVVWRWPLAGFACLLCLTLLVEQFDFGRITPITRRIPFFDNLDTFTPLPLPVNLLEILLVLTAFAWLTRRAAARDLQMSDNALVVPTVVFLASLAAWGALGVLRDGDWRIAAWELRALFYLCVILLLLPQMISTRRDVEILLWVCIGALGVKALQGVWRYAVVLGGELGKDRAITAHEDALFLASLLILLAAMLLLDGPKAYKVGLALVAVPALVTFVATNRRVAYVALAAGIICLFVLVASDERRRRLAVVSGLALALAATAYTGLFWNSGGPLGRPARALRSIREPESDADYQSNLYRRVEELNLMNTIKENPIVGAGFGRPYKMVGRLSALEFSLQDYIPHNEILWLWAKMGTLGFVVFWMFVGAVVVKGIALFHDLRSSLLRSVVATAVVLMIMQLVVSYADLQLTFYRNMVYLGVFLAVLVRAGDLDGCDRDAVEVG